MSAVLDGMPPNICQMKITSASEEANDCDWTKTHIKNFAPG